MLEERDLPEFSAGTSCIHIGSDICIYLWSYYIYSNGIFKYFQPLGWLLSFNSETCPWFMALQLCFVPVDTRGGVAIAAVVGLDGGRYDQQKSDMTFSLWADAMQPPICLEGILAIFSNEHVKCSFRFVCENFIRKFNPFCNPFRQVDPFPLSQSPSCQVCCGMGRRLLVTS